MGNKEVTQWHLPHSTRNKREQFREKLALLGSGVSFFYIVPGEVGKKKENGCLL